MKHFTLAAVLAFSLAALLPVAAQDAPPPVTITLAGYAVPREAYDAIIPLFQHFWLEQTGQQVTILESYQASGAQSRAIMGGLEADVAALSFEPDITRLVDAGLVSEDWNDNAFNGIVTESLVVFAVRPGNPLSIHDWTDVITEGVEVITPDPATSGGAQWNILGGYGAALRGFVPGYEGEEGAPEFLRALAANIRVLDRDGRESFLTFERGIGDVALTYENEVYAGLLAGGEYELVYPTSTIRIENPVAVIDTYVDAHGTREVAEAFVNFLWSDDAQRIYANHGFRPVSPAIRAELGIVETGAEATAESTPVAAEPSSIEHNPLIVFPPVIDEFLITELGGWPEVRSTMFGDTGLVTQIIAEAQGQ
ncbi:MAG: sulfate ABC transporter substrate-binding protein [Chloroflexi bacterium OLB15]|nr:MAG: sulfate ABC transporter substrate-binding protein [Chloroflexi bacterium OLB15]